MATLDNSNIVNGNIVQPNDLLQLYLAFTAGGGYNVSISGSLTGSATTSTNASKLDPTLNASTNANYNVLFAASSSATYETIYKEDGTIMTYNPSTNTLNVTSSRAVTASYALNAATPSNTVTVSAGQGEITPLGDFSMKAFAGITDAFLGGGLPNSQSVSISLS